ncbi:MAG: response regulator [Deltaproteobacteria bacterium]|nr:response regulator [Deltaproteobacteria bacterium]
MDDSPSIRRHVVQKLEPMSFHVTEASSGEEALALTLEQTFDLVVSDIEMEAITGVQLCRVFRGDPGMKDIAFVLLTAAKEAKTRFWGRNAGADCYLAKEDMDEQLLPAVEELMRGRTPRDSVRPELTGTPLERASAVLDHHLFDVVVQSEVRRIESSSATRCWNSPPKSSAAPIWFFIFLGRAGQPIRFAPADPGPRVTQLLAWQPSRSRRRASTRPTRPSRPTRSTVRAKTSSAGPPSLARFGSETNRSAHCKSSAAPTYAPRPISEV